MKQIGKIKILSAAEIEKSHVSIGFEGLDRDLFNPEKCYDILAKSGVKYARCQTGWVKCEKSAASYDFAWLDVVVENLSRRGIIPWFNVGFGNPVYMNEISNPAAVGCVPLLYGETAYKAWLDFAKKLGERYGKIVEHFEIWNEPNIDTFWFPGNPDPKLYAKLVKETGAAIRSTSPRAKIGADVSSPKDLTFIKKTLDSLSAADFNFLSIHTYATRPELGYESLIEQIRDFLNLRGMNEIEIWQGEGGFPSWAYKNHWLLREGIEPEVGERAQAIWMLRRFFMDISLGLARSSFFQMADMWERPYFTARDVRPKPAAQGILNGVTYTPKLSYRTISHLASLMSGDFRRQTFYASLTNRAEARAEEVVSSKVMTFQKDESKLCAYYHPTDVREKNETIATAGIRIFAKFAEPILVDMLTGAIYELRDEAADDEDFSAFEGLPLRDYPMVITERRAVALEAAETSDN